MASLFGSGVNPPNFQPVNLTGSLQSKGMGIANQYANADSGLSTNETEAQAGNVLDVSTQQAEMNNQLANLYARDQLTAQAQNNSGLIAGLGSFGALLGGL